MLEQHFNDLKGTLKKLLDERLMSLLQEVDAIEQESIKPLDECQKLIEHGVSTADDLLREGKAGPDTKSWLNFPMCILLKTVVISTFGLFWTSLKPNVKKTLKLGRCSEELINIIPYKSTFKYFTPMLGCPCISVASP